MNTELGLDDTLYQLLVDSMGEDLASNSSTSPARSEPSEDATALSSSTASLLRKRAREQEVLEEKQRNHTSTIAKQVSIRNGYLLRFPTAFANCVNGANFTGLTQLMDSYLFHKCNVRYAFSNETHFSCAGGGGLVNFFSLANAFYPDRITVVHTAAAGDNRLTCSFFFKFTDCKYIYDSVLSHPIDPTYLSFYPPARADSLRRKMRLDCRPKPVQDQLESLVNSDKDLIVYGSIHMQMNIQEVTEKIIGINVIANFTSAHPAEQSDADMDVHEAFSNAPQPVVV